LVNRQPPFTSNHIATPRTFKLNQAALHLDPRTTYRAVHGADRCPACAASLRAEPHHNAVGVLTLVCDGCGFRLVL
jgi:hypothetical protein